MTGFLLLLSDVPREGWLAGRPLAARCALTLALSRRAGEGTVLVAEGRELARGGGDGCGLRGCCVEFRASPVCEGGVETRPYVASPSLCEGEGDARYPRMFFIASPM